MVFLILFLVHFPLPALAGSPSLANAMDSTLIILWVFTWAAIGLMVLRLLVRKWKGSQFLLGDYFSLGAILCALVRLALVHVILIWGTNNMTTTFRHTHHFTSEEIRRREIASKLVLANRVFYNS